MDKLMTAIDVARIDVAQLAQDKGCTLKMQHADDAPLYWVENGYFISRPFCRLAELEQFIRKLPVFMACESSANR
jgi:hypothetical protein